MIISATEKMFTWLTPSRCFICNREESSWCEACRQTTCPQPILRCFKCNKLTSDQMLCSKCASRSPLDELYFGGHYDKSLKKLISSYKFDGRRGLAEPFARLLDSRLPYFTSDTFVTYVPTISPHIRKRGIDQAERLAWWLANIRGYGFESLLNRDDRLEQRGQSRTVRLKQLKTVFQIKVAQDIRGATILLVDDVMTTGATLESCARVLKNAGAGSIIGVALAHGNVLL